MKTRKKFGRATVCTACSELLEDRRLFTAFTVVPAQSILNVSVVANAGGTGVQIESQGPSTINPAENSLTTHVTGTLLANVGAGTLLFPSGSSLAAEVNGSWTPGSDPALDNPANYNTPGSADFGGMASLGFFGNEAVAGRNLIFDLYSPSIAQSGGAYPVGSLSLISTQGDVYYDTDGSGPIGTENLTGDTGLDQSTSSATLQTSGSTQTLTVPVNAVDMEVIDNVPVTITYTGTLVATAMVQPILPSPSYYLRLDADQKNIDIWDNSTGTGPIAQQLLYSQQPSLTLTASSGAGSITLDDSNGKIIPPGGVTIVGNGSTALNLIGSTGSDTVALNASQFVFDSVPINFSGVTQTSLDPSTGTDALAVNAGTLILPALAAGGGLKVRRFSSISIASGAELLATAPASHSDRALIMTTSLSIAGSTGHWTGTLDLTGNDMDVPSGSLSTISNQLSQGYNLAGGGHWNGAGVTSTTAGADSTHLTAVGAIQNNQNGTAIYGSGTGQTLFDGITPGASDVLIKYTYLGDATLDGKVDGSDYSRIDNGFKNALTGWFNGDFNYDGVVNGADYTLIDNAFNVQRTSLAEQVVTPAASVATPPQKINASVFAAAVPIVFPEWSEPGTSLVAVADFSQDNLPQLRRLNSHRTALVDLPGF